KLCTQLAQRNSNKLTITLLPPQQTLTLVITPYSLILDLLIVKGLKVLQEEYWTLMIGIETVLLTVSKLCQ
ncbi:MAG: hypothetical protein ACKO96_43455, partial [Flammeovirgaceae bacterium]